MPAEAVLFALLHLLVFAYWLGGDIGVFYSSFLLTDASRPAAARLAAGKIVSDVDLAPRICLLLAAPTGLALAATKGWLSLPEAALSAAFIAALLWIAVILRLHLKHGPDLLRRLDLFARAGLLLTLAGSGVAGVLGALDIPLFIAVKLILLAFCVAMGLLVRAALSPFGPAFVSLAAKGPSAEGDAAISASLARARPFVVAIWIALVAAAALGVATPS